MMCSSLFAGGKEVNLFDGKTLDGWDYFLVKPELKMSDVWSVKDGVMVCKGEPLGYIATEKKYKNYKLIVEYRWAPGQKPGNSGILMRIIGEKQGLPKCIETQLKHGDAGDIYGFHGFKVGGKERFFKHEGDFVGKMTGVKKIKNLEKKPGEWNKFEITVDGGSVVSLLNGEKVNEASDCDVVAGQIGFQSEGGEIQFRTIKLLPLK